MNFDNFKTEWLGRAIDYDHVFQFQCVDLILQYIYECYGIAGGVWGNAIDYWTKTGINGFNQPLLNHFTKIPNSDAVKGDIVVLNGLPGNPDGHIGIATGNIDATMVEILEQNGQDGSGSGVGGNAVRVRYVSRSRVAGLLRPGQPAPAVVVNPYTIETIPAKEVQLNKDTHRWGLHYDNFTAINNNPEGSIAAGTIVTVVAVLHHNIGYNYYLPDASTASGYNVLDCDDYHAPAVINPNPAPPAAPLTSPNTEPYEVVIEIPGYASSNMAVNHIDQKVTIPIGTYFIYNKRFATDSKAVIAFNLTKTPGTPGAWINPDDNVLHPAESEPAVVEEPKPEEKPAEDIPEFSYTYRAFEKPELYVAMRDSDVPDLTGKRKAAHIRKYDNVWISGTFTVNDVDYALPLSAQEKDWWYGIEWTDKTTNMPNLELESEVFDSQTTLEERQATKTLHKLDYVRLTTAHVKNFVLGILGFLSKIKLAKAKNKKG